MEFVSSSAALDPEDIDDGDFDEPGEVDVMNSGDGLEIEIPLGDPEPKKEVPYPGVSRRRTVLREIEYGPLTLRELDGCDEIKGCGLLEGFQSVGVTSVIAASFIREELNLPVIGVITSDEFPPMGLVDTYQPCTPARIFGNDKVVVFLSEVNFGKHSAVVNAMTSLVFDFAVRHEVSHIYTVDGLPLESLDAIDQEDLRSKVKTEKAEQKSDEKKKKAQDDRKMIRFVTTSEEVGKILIDKKHKPLQDAGVSGITGVILAESIFQPPRNRCGVDVTCLLAPVSRLFPDAWGATYIVKLLSELCPQFNIDVGPLETRARELEDKILKAVRQTLGKLKRDELPPSHMYS